MNRERRRHAAQQYMPKHVRILLVAEAPPSDTDCYFYFCDVTSHDHLFRNVMLGLFGEKQLRMDKQKGLLKLKESAVFLIDLNLDPVNGSDLIECVSDLVDRCRELTPDHIVLIKANVYDVAYDALSRAGLPVVDKRIYFPSHGRQREFLRQFREAIDSIGYRREQI